MTESWITVATYYQHPQAVLAKSLLDAAGIQCWLRDEHVSRMYGGLQGAAFGGIKLQVRPEDEQAALEALQHDSGIPGDDLPGEPES
jgi:hypothetical protein